MIKKYFQCFGCALCGRSLLLIIALGLFPISGLEAVDRIKLSFLSDIFMYNDSAGSKWNFSRNVKEPYIMLEFPDYDTISWTESEVTHFQCEALDVRLYHSIISEDQFNLSLFGAFRYAETKWSIDSELWHHFRGYNPTTGGFGGPPVQWGYGEFDLNGHVYSAGIGASFSWKRNKSALDVEICLYRDVWVFGEFNLFEVFYSKRGGVLRGDVLHDSVRKSYSNRVDLSFSWKRFLNDNIAVLLTTGLAYVDDVKILNRSENIAGVILWGPSLEDVIFLKIGIGLEVLF
jgi:hypothetical protein